MVHIEAWLVIARVAAADEPCECLLPCMGKIVRVELEAADSIGATRDDLQTVHPIGVCSGMNGHTGIGSALFRRSHFISSKDYPGAAACFRKIV